MGRGYLERGSSAVSGFMSEMRLSSALGMARDRGGEPGRGKVGTKKRGHLSPLLLHYNINIEFVTPASGGGNTAGLTLSC